MFGTITNCPRVVTYIYIYIYIRQWFFLAQYLLYKRVCVDEEHGHFVVERREFIVNELELRSREKR